MEAMARHSRSMLKRIASALGSLFLLGSTMGPSLRAAPLQETPAARHLREDFSTAPLPRGWETYGAASLFVWDADLQQLRVTWDSAMSNSYFRLPLGTVATHEDDFSASLELLLEDIAAGTRPGYPGTFQIAFGFQNREDADGAGFIRGTGANTPNLVEFNFLPDTGFGPTVWPAMFPTNGLLNYGGSGDFGIFDLPVGVPLEIRLDYTASNQTAAITIRTEGALVGTVVDAALVPPVKGFKVDAFTISSYSDAGQAFPGSILAHGMVDNIQIVAPPPPIRASNGRVAGTEWEHNVLSSQRWRYVLESTEDFATWAQVSAETDGTGGWIQLRANLSGPASHRFFRVRAQR